LKLDTEDSPESRGFVPEEGRDLELGEAGVVRELHAAPLYHAIDRDLFDASFGAFWIGLDGDLLEAVPQVRAAGVIDALLLGDPEAHGITEDTRWHQRVRAVYASLWRALPSREAIVGRC
jgi:hypothetical protein